MIGRSEPLFGFITLQMMVMILITKSPLPNSYALRHRSPFAIV